NDLVLECLRNIAEVVAITSHPNNQVAIFFGIGLGGTQSFRSDHVELNMMAVHAEIRSDEMQQAIDPLFSLHQRRRELLIQERSARSGVVHLGSGSDDRGRAMEVGALRRRN